jgi:hypothetical protein
MFIQAIKFILHATKVLRVVSYVIAMVLILVATGWQFRYRRQKEVLDHKTKILRAGFVSLLTLMSGILVLLLANEFSEENMLSTEVLIPFACASIPLIISSAVGAYRRLEFQIHLGNFITKIQDKARKKQE